MDIRCPSCQRPLRLPDSLMGKEVRCPICSETFRAEEKLENVEPQLPRDPQGIRGQEKQSDPAWTSSSFTQEPERRQDPEDFERPHRSRKRDYDDDVEDQDYRPRRITYRQAKEKINPPALSLLITHSLAAFFSLLGFALNMSGVLLLGPKQQDELHFLNLAFGGVGLVISLIWAGVCIAGSLQMKQLKNYPLSMAASIMSIIPCFGCCILTLPVGIWALVVLNDPEIRDAFSR